MSDFPKAAAWYEEREPGLGTELVRVIRQAVICKSVGSSLRHRRRKVRWFLPPRFPYRIVYRVLGVFITVITVLHSARHDRHWQERV
jgi:plasmid stabilization system protein ParE